MSAFEPDFDELTREAWHVGNRKPNTSATRRVIAAYRRQQAERGVVEVRRVDIVGVRDKIAFLADWVAINDAPDIDNELRSFVRGLDFALDPGPFAGLAAAQE